ncbi:MAG: PEGA domain-containing protein [Acidobacteria bacterium]|nr:PEGA domain-containing protein [Acidobacteriota bacterium]
MAALSVLTCSAQIVIPEGTKIRVRLDQTLSSATAEEGQMVELSVTDGIKVGDTLVIAEGARVTGNVKQAQGKRMMGRAGKLDFSIDRVKSIDGQWIPLRYTVTKKAGQSHAVSTGIITAGVAAVFWPAAPVILLRKGKDITMNRGLSFDVFTDSNHTLAQAPRTMSGALPDPAYASPGGTDVSAWVSVVSPVSGADIEVDGRFVGHTPTTIILPGGQHQIVVKQGAKSWQRTLQVHDKSAVTLKAAFQ